ncbi:S-adenosyl-L-methionine-dependent methyltransferase [Schizophyllum commune Tattone D]|nr:S-adenosyl-L-methionine-dependent methyltransferase [Schizophyllum commune Tattone D]
MAPSNLRQLLHILTEQVNIIEDLAERNGVSGYPSLVERPTEEQNRFISDSAVVHAAYLTNSAASQLAAALRPSGLPLYDRAASVRAFVQTFAMRIASDACVPEILRDAGAEGLHINSIAAATWTDENILDRTLRFLCAHYVFQEISTDVFAHNRPSWLMDTGKPVREVAQDAINKKKTLDDFPFGLAPVNADRYKDTNSIRAFLDNNTDEQFKAAAYLPDSVLRGEHLRRAPVSEVFNTDEDIWGIMRRSPGRSQRLQMVMPGFANLCGYFKNLRGFFWENLPKVSLVVDVGCGIGTQTARIARRGPNLNIQVVGQDLPHVIANETVPEWDTDPSLKAMMDLGRVKFEAHSMFESQRQRSVPVAAFYLCYIIHDWPRDSCVKILRHLNVAASSDTVLVIAEQIVPQACPSPDSLVFDGMNTPDAPAPLLPNLGQAFAEVYLHDFTIAVMTTGQQRTLGEFDELTREAGWKIVDVHQTPGSCFSEIVCRKV